MMATFHRVPVVRRQLAAKRGRMFAATTGVAVALLLVLALTAIFAGIEGRLTSYIDGSGADVVVAQAGVKTMHMTQSALPATDVAAVRRVPGVAGASGIVYRGAFVESVAGKSAIVAVVGGGPLPKLVSGHAPSAGGIVVDRAVADQLGLKRGGVLRLLGTRLHISGEVEGTAAISGAFVFVEQATLARMLHLENVVSYILVRARPGESSTALAREIERRLPRVTASTRQQFSASERRTVGGMSTDIVRGMTLVAFIIGVAVAGLVAYSLTLSQLRDYGVLRAIGLSARRAVTIALGQVAALVVAGFALALALVWLLAQLLPVVSPTLALEIRLDVVVGAAVVAAFVALGAAVIPVLRVISVDPASVFRRAA
jgi:putative ABC transport system permease protein